MKAQHEGQKQPTFGQEAGERKTGCHLSISQGFLKMGETALSIGATACQFFLRNPRGGQGKPLDRKDIENLEAFQQRRGRLAFVVHAPYTLNPCSVHEHVRQFSLTAFMEDLEKLHSFPGAMYVFHPGCHGGQGTEAGISQIAAFLNRALESDQGPQVLLETMSGKGSEIGARFEELASILKRVERGARVGVCLDTCHVYAAGYDVAARLDDVLEEFDRVIGLSRLFAVHLNDSMTPLGSRKDRHAKIGEGCLGLAAMTRIFTHPALARLPFILETPNELPGYAAEISILKHAASCGQA